MHHCSRIEEPAIHFPVEKQFSAHHTQRYPDAARHPVQSRLSVQYTQNRQCISRSDVAVESGGRKVVSHVAPATAYARHLSCHDATILPLWSSLNWFVCSLGFTPPS